MGDSISFIVYARPEPQGSAKGFVINGRAIVTSANKKLKPYRQELTHTAQVALREAGLQAPFAAKHVPVSVSFHFFLQKGDSVPKKRRFPSVKPDLDKLIRSTADSLTGIMYHDDGQIVELRVNKDYGVPERAEITVRFMEEGVVTQRNDSSMQSLFSAGML